jgi:hypothetical protein
VGTTFLAVSTFLVGALQASGRDRMPAALALGAVVVEVVGLSIAIPIGVQHGGVNALVAAGIAFDVAAIGVAVTLLVLAWWQFRWPLRVRGPIVFVLACAAMVLTLKALPHEGRISMVLSAIVASAVYAVIAVALGLLSRGDLRTLRNALPGGGRPRPATPTTNPAS